MKFAHSFKEELQNNEYPPEWLDAAIRYRQLKKCIKKVQRELEELGLTIDMLKLLAEEKNYHVVPADRKSNTKSETQQDIHDTMTRRDLAKSSGGDSSGVCPNEESGESDVLQNKRTNTANIGSDDDEPEWSGQGIKLSYWFDGTLQSFVPKLFLTVDSCQGIPVNLGLAPDTRKALEDLVHALAFQMHHQGDAWSTATPNPTTTRITEVGELEKKGDAEKRDHISPDASVEGEKKQKRKRRDSQQNIQIPLSADVEFFRTLTHEISSLDVIQSKEEQRITNNVVLLGDSVTDVVKPKSFTKDSDLYSWREIFRIYLESGIFISQLEREGRIQRTVEMAEEKLKWFQAELKRVGVTKHFKNKHSLELFKNFMDLNMSILRLLRFQSINKTAMRKILKKFDKRTALGAREAFPTFIASDPFLSSELAKAICYTMNDRLLNIIPQLDDYLCPICSSISVKPVRLDCTHVFCVRCLVKLQREKKQFCPICRGDVVLTANADNLDISLLNFLKHYFPKEAKLKQAENEKEVALEQFRALQARSGSVECSIM
ncbi:SPX domain-containing protein [Kalaharituber pfeilii]|nr:SPX domain-containing protein [Kalaharituber pfeilii]